MCSLDNFCAFVDACRTSVAHVCDDLSRVVVRVVDGVQVRVIIGTGRVCEVGYRHGISCAHGCAIESFGFERPSES
jgi:hypothetical protein